MLEPTETDRQFSRFIADVLKRSPKSIGVVLRANPEVYEFIMKWTNFLKEDTKFITRVYYAMHLLTDYVKCKVCGKAIIKDIYRLNKPYLDFCSRKCQNVKMREHFASLHGGIDNPWKMPEIIKKIQEKRKAKLESILAKMQATCIERYGYKNPFQVDQFKEKVRKTNLDKYGYEYNSQSPEFYKNKRYKFIYNGIGFHSRDEINIWKFFEANLEEGTYFYQPPDGIFKYNHVDGSEHFTIVDFKIILNGKPIFVEFKGGQFIDSDGRTWKACFREPNESDEQYAIDCQNYELKHQCLLKNNVVIIERYSTEENIRQTFKFSGIIL